MATPGGQIPKFCPETTPNKGSIQITLQLGPFNSKSKLKIYPGQKNDDISSKLIAKQGGNPIYGHPGGQIPKF